MMVLCREMQRVPVLGLLEEPLGVSLMQETLQSRSTDATHLSSCVQERI